MSEKTENKMLMFISILAFLTLISSLYTTIVDFSLWYYLHNENSEKAITEILIPSLPYIVFWLVLSISCISAYSHDVDHSFAWTSKSDQLGCDWVFKIIILSDQHDLLIGDQHHANMQLNSYLDQEAAPRICIF